MIFEQKIERAVKDIEEKKQYCKAWLDKSDLKDMQFYKGFFLGLNSALRSLSIFAGKEEWYDPEWDNVDVFGESKQESTK